MKDPRQLAYRPRVTDQLVSEYLDTFGGVVIEGAKWCGKTWTGRHHSISAVYVDKKQVQDQAALAPEKLLTGDRPMLVDEWQDAPELWDVARRMIDDSASKGLFLFTGSAVPPVNATSHSGTGRFARLRMRPMSTFELGQSSGVVSLKALMSGGLIEPELSKLDYESAIRLICRGGWPGSIDKSDQQAFRVAFQYLAAVAQSDISRLDGVARDPRKVMAVLRSLGRNTATYARPATILNDVLAQSEPGVSVSLTSVHNYLAAFDRIFITEDLPSWRYSLRSKTQLLTSPKRHFVDPSLAVAAIEADPESLFADPHTTGLLFESLVVRDLRAYAQASEGGVFHYHDKTNLEADVIVTMRGNRWGAVEVKLGSHQCDQAAKNLLRLKAKLAGVVPEPGFLAVLTASGGIAHTRNDGVHVVPIDCLGP